MILLIFIQDASGASRSLCRAEFINLAWSSVGRGSREEYGLLFDSVVVTQEHHGLLLDSDTVKEEGRVEWGGLCSFLMQELSDKMKNTRTSDAPRWKPPRTLTCPHRDPVQKVKRHWPSGGLREEEFIMRVRTYCPFHTYSRMRFIWKTFSHWLTGESQTLLTRWNSTLLNIVCVVSIRVLLIKMAHLFWDKWL